MREIRKLRLRASSVQDWVNYPEFAQVLESELENLYRESSEVFISGNPTLTHEIKAKLIGREQLLQELLAMFKDGNIRVFFNERNGIELEGYNGEEEASDSDEYGEYGSGE